MIAVGIFSVWLLVVVLVVIATVSFGSRVSNRTGAVGVIGKIVAVLATLGASIALLGTLIGLLKVFGALRGGYGDVAQKARLVGEGISEAMNCTAFGILVWLPFFIVLVVIVRRKRAG